jgi:hypothetical protein
MNTVTETEISHWSNTQATREVACPKCNQEPGHRCIQPSGRFNGRPHAERASAYRQKIGLFEFKRRHSITPGVPLAEIRARLMKGVE